MSDATFEDGTERPLRLRGETVEDLQVISALLQDAVVSGTEIAWLPKRRKFTLAVNRFRWEDAPAANRLNRGFERVKSLLVVSDALKVRSDGIDPKDREVILSLLSIAFEPGDDATGRLRMVFAGDGEIAIDVECLDVTLVDVSRPYLAVSGRKPGHEDNELDE